MKIALDISPLAQSSGHKVRGVGSYVKLLMENLEKYDDENKYIFFEDRDKIPNEADLVHYPYFDPFFLTLPRSFSKKSIVTVHDLTPIVFPKNFPPGLRGKIKWSIQKRRLRRASAIVTDSEYSKKDIVKIVNTSQEKVAVVYLAADKAFQKLKGVGWKEEIKKKYNLPPQFILYVGDATWNKNLPNLIAAVKKTDLNLVMVGKVLASEEKEIQKNNWNNDLRLILKEVKNDQKFIKLGFVPTDDLVRIYNLASVFVLPSVYEGFGLPALEAMRCGCPVITTKGGSLPEVVGDAVMFIENYFDVDEITQKITQLFNNAKLKSEFSKKGLEQAKKFTVEKTIKDLIKVYEKYGKSS